MLKSNSMEKDPRKSRRGYYLKPGSKLSKRFENLKKRSNTVIGNYLFQLAYKMAGVCTILFFQTENLPTIEERTVQGIVDKEHVIEKAASERPHGKIFIANLKTNIVKLLKKGAADESVGCEFDEDQDNNAESEIGIQEKNSDDGQSATTAGGLYF